MTEHPSALFIGALKRFRGRMRLIVYLKYASVTPALLLIGVDIAILWGGFSIRSVAPVVVPAIVLCQLTAALLARWSAADFMIATTLDRDLQLRNLLVSALDCLDRADAISHLVLRGAADRLSEFPTSVVPVTVSRSCRWMWAVALAGAIWCATAFDVTPATQALARGMPASAETHSRERVGRANAVAPLATRESQGNGAPVPPTVTVSARSDNDTSRGEQPAPTAGEPHRRSEGTETNHQRDNATASILSTRSAAPGLGGRTSARQQASAATRTGRGWTVGGTAHNGAGSGGGASAGRARGGGGVSNRAPAPDVNVKTRSGPLSRAEFAAVYRRQRARAEAAIAHERVPARYRSYIRDYFRALREVEPQ